ncbi:MAG: Rieske 2Fe-2S domain-containing protein [Acidimicrobiia bacterium]
MPPGSVLAVPNRSRYRANVGWVILPLRAFLGTTFVFAGLQKLADPNFLDDHAPSGVHQQMLAASRTSPIGGVLTTFAHHATVVGLLIAFAELAVGVGALVGLWTRVAAIGGALVSVGFLLSVSWHSHPYYLGSDVVFLFAWTPMVVAGAGGVLSLDAWLAARARKQMRVAPIGRVDIEFAAVRNLCGSYAKGRCERLHGAACDPAPCPILGQTPRLRREVAGELDRREFLGAARAAAGIAAGATVVAGGAAGLGRLLHVSSPGQRTVALGKAGPARAPSTTTSTTNPTSGTTAPTPPTTTAPPPPGTAIGPATSVPVAGAASFTDPISGVPAYVVQPTAGVYRGFSGVCTHAGCTVDYSQSGNRFQCPCHGAEFDAATGAVLGGPTNRPLPAITVAVGADGQLYVAN